MFTSAIPVGSAVFGACGARGAYGQNCSNLGAGYGQAWGQETQGGGGGNFLETLSAYAPAVSDIVEEFVDPHRQVEILKAKIANAKARGAPASKIALLEAKLRAAQRQAGLEEEQETSTREWRILGKTASWGVVLVGGSAALLLIVMAMKAAKKGR